MRVWPIMISPQHPRWLQPRRKTCASTHSVLCPGPQQPARTRSRTRPVATVSPSPATAAGGGSAARLATPNGSGPAGSQQALATRTYQVNRHGGQAARGRRPAAFESSHAASRTTTAWAGGPGFQSAAHRSKKFKMVSMTCHADWHISKPLGRYM